MTLRFRPSLDVRPVTEFRAHTSAVLEQVQTTKRPVVLTQHGRSAAVLLDVDVYESLVEEVAVIRDIRKAEEQLAEAERFVSIDVLLDGTANQLIIITGPSSQAARHSTVETVN